MERNGIFINYRRDDSAPSAGRLHDFLEKRFSGRTFMDVSGIDLGEDFEDAVKKALAKSYIVLAVIGPSWLTLQDQKGTPRIAAPNDLCAQELEFAFSNEARVIPVLVSDATMPSIRSLPSKLRKLSLCQAIEISDSQFAHDADRLANEISRLMGEQEHWLKPGEVILGPTVSVLVALRREGVHVRYELPLGQMLEAFKKRLIDDRKLFPNYYDPDKYAATYLWRTREPKLNDKATVAENGIVNGDILFISLHEDGGG